MKRTRLFRPRCRRANIIIGEYANRVIAAAVEHRAQIVFENIDTKSMACFLKRSQFQKMAAALEHKALCAGLPKPIQAPAAFTSQTCHVCGFLDRGNRVSQREFQCLRCGHKDNADDNASVMIALRGLHQQTKGGKFQKFSEFKKWLEGLKHRDGRGASAGQ